MLDQKSAVVLWINFFIYWAFHFYFDKWCDFNFCLCTNLISSFRINRIMYRSMTIVMAMVYLTVMTVHFLKWWSYDTLSLLVWYSVRSFLKYHISVHSRRTSTWSYTASVMDTGWTITRGRERRKAVRRTSDHIKPERWSALKPNSTTNRGMPRRSRWRRREWTGCYRNRHLLNLPWKWSLATQPSIPTYELT